MRAAKTSLLAIAFAATSACDNRPDNWTAFIYPEGADIGDYFAMTGFESFEHCQEAAISAIRGFGRAAVADYECGYKCGGSSGLGGGTTVCKETRK